MSARILVADDIQANRRMLQAKLEANFHVVLEAANGEDVLKVAREEQPEIILLDVMMPIMDGFEACRRLKADEATAHIPVVMLTALSDSEHRIRGLEAGAEDFITKPIDDFQLNSRIEALTRYAVVAAELRHRQASSDVMTGLDDLDAEDAQRPIRVLVLDQRATQAGRLVSTLIAAGHEAVSYSEAEEGLGELTSGVDLIIMPLDGQSFDPLKICTHFRMSRMTRPISIIVVADPYDTRRASQALAYGASDVISLPIDPLELQARIRTQARRTRYIEIMRRRVDRGIELSVIDQLTGLYNRRYMMTQLHQWMKRAVMGNLALSVVSLDIDHFKHVNDTYGHAAGDDILREVAERLRHNVRPVDVVCRPGGEEFLVILPETPHARAAAAAERLRLAIEDRSFRLASGQIIDITVSAGVSVLAGTEDTPAALMGRADTALYAAKRAGRNQVCTEAA